MALHALAPAPTPPTVHDVTYIGAPTGLDVIDALPLDAAGHVVPTATAIPYPASRNAADAGLPEDAAAWPIAFVAAWVDYDTINVYATAHQHGADWSATTLDDYTFLAGTAVIDPNQAAGVPHYPRPSADLLAFDAELDLMQDDLPGAP